MLLLRDKYKQFYACLVLCLHHHKCYIFVNIDEYNLRTSFCYYLRFYFDLVFNQFFGIFHIFFGKYMLAYLSLSNVAKEIINNCLHKSHFVVLEKNNTHVLSLLKNCFFLPIIKWVRLSKRFILDYKISFRLRGCLHVKFRSRDEIIPVYGEMSLTVYTFLPRWNFILGWTHPFQKERNEISSRDEKKKKRHVNTSSRMKF